MPERKHIRTFRSKKLHPEHVKLLNEAIRKNVKGGDHNVKITYRKESGEVSERKIKPLGVRQKDLLLAHCHERNAVRSFKIGRISKMEKSAFWIGFEKGAGQPAKKDKKDSKYNLLKHVGAVSLGGLAGAGAGSFAKHPHGKRIGALMGMLAGGGAYRRTVGW